MEEVSNIFLIDSNALITPYKSYYPFDFAPSFWSQIRDNIEAGNIALLDVVKDEIEKGDDALSLWSKELSVARLIDRRQPQIISHYSNILNYIQTSGFYSSYALAEWSNVNEADPWLIATAKETGYILVTFETSAGALSKKTPSKRCKIPDICNAFQVKYDNLFSMMRILSISLH